MNFVVVVVCVGLAFILRVVDIKEEVHQVGRARSQRDREEEEDAKVIASTEARDVVDGNNGNAHLLKTKRE